MIPRSVWKMFQTTLGSFAHLTMIKVRQSRVADSRTHRLITWIMKFYFMTIRYWLWRDSLSAEKSISCLSRKLYKCIPASHRALFVNIYRPTTMNIETAESYRILIPSVGFYNKYVEGAVSYIIIHALTYPGVRLWTSRFETFSSYLLACCFLLVGLGIMLEKDTPQLKITV